MKNLRALLSILFVAALCAFAVLAAGWAAGIPAQAQIIYGPPAPQLEFTQRWRLAWSLTSNVDALNLPADPAGVEQLFTIEGGLTADGVIQDLTNAGLITNTSLFRDYLIYTGADTRLVPGEYTLSPKMTPLEIAAAIQNIEATGVSFVILPGWRLEEVAAALPTSGLEITPGEFLAAGGRVPGGAISALWLADASHEGLLLPDTYSLPRSLTAEALLDILAENFLQNVTSDIRAGLEQQGLTLYEGVTLASIIQREAVISGEQPTIASVFINRLRAGWRLDADPTVQYALGYDDGWGWWKAPLALADLEIDSPYNTYRIIGLPPGPISNPGLDAIQAVAFPEETAYFFFQAACDGSGRHNFAVTFDEHQGNACP